MSPQDLKVEVDIIIEQGRQLAGVVFYDGETILPFGEKLFAVPISVLIQGSVNG